MVKYKRTYLQYFGYSKQDFIPCELCGAQAVDIHHIENRKQRKDLENDINNLMALCRECHLEYGDKKRHKEWLKIKHKELL